MLRWFRLTFLIFFFLFLFLRIIFLLFLFCVVVPAFIKIKRLQVSKMICYSLCLLFA